MVKNKSQLFRLTFVIRLLKDVNHSSFIISNLCVNIMTQIIITKNLPLILPIMQSNSCKLKRTEACKLQNSIL